jgi:cell division protein FtsL
LIQKDYEYVQGSAARQLQTEVPETRRTHYDVYEQNSVLKAKKQYKDNRKSKLKLVLSVLAVFVATLAVMYRFALITQLSYNISQKEATYNELRNANSILKVEIETGTDLAEIKEIAETRLGMQKPDKNQIVYIKVPRTDYTVVMNTQDGAAIGSGNLLKAFIYKLSGLIRLFE